MADIPQNHPRYESLVTRDLIVDGVKNGITAIHGLTAHGRGEAFDYLIGEKTIEMAVCAQRAAVAMLLLAKKPVISVNGNTAALVPEGIIKLADFTQSEIEVNLFHRTETRVHRIVNHLKSKGAHDVLGQYGDAKIDLSHGRGIVDKNGIFSADVVLVPLEDGDRCQTLVGMDKKVISIDLNPLSRTSNSSTISIIDNVLRAIPNMIEFAKVMKSNNNHSLQDVIDSYNNREALSSAIYEIGENLKSHAIENNIPWNHFK
ncbi:4-phosphopantoate--beta-alanine ligase [Methanosalsum natronophilum]|uniref:4-phosphopantoate--beta-alanine ligase n=1 Tax=Methanosalsum natronophilum TaxID=768733 RepID=A0A3R7VTN4_9EURY|nr:4-phosphopantoate--beta-alanine ligase [Methanosalsum natronophilum]MCS3923031.1 4-phosphopantoate--beta-alanine ligase [Methanosalsum natronophilum]RQD86268.1 MAG: phosphopantothenate/pantothenate synthetase [Methanosalsum natronophilum]